jgi:hypothetical protein
MEFDTVTVSMMMFCFIAIVLCFPMSQAGLPLVELPWLLVHVAVSRWLGSLPLQLLKNCCFLAVLGSHGPTVPAWIKFGYPFRMNKWFASSCSVVGLWSVTAWWINLEFLD